MAQCAGVLMIKGEAFKCEMDAPHNGWACANLDAQAIWGSELPLSEMTPPEQVQ